MTEMLMPSVLDLVTAQHRQAEVCTRREVNIDFPPARELAQACNSIFGLVDREDDFQREAARLAWRLKQTVLQTLLPFNDERLGLKQMTERFLALAESMRSIAPSVSSIQLIVNELLAHRANPKLGLIAGLLESEGDPFGCAILVGLQGWSTPGWPFDIDAAGDLGLRGISLIRSRRDAKSLVFSRLLIPGTLSFASRPLVQDLVYGGRAAEVVIARYKGERIYIPEALPLPSDTLFAVISSRRPLAAFANPTAHEELDKWANDSFWDSIRAQHKDVNPVSDRDMPVKARFVLFADESGAFLPEDGTVIEVSNLLDGEDKFDLDPDHMPRKSVAELDERDLVLLRLSGSGDYLEEVADALMAVGGCPTLPNEATAWKVLLVAALRRHGERVVAKIFRERGGKLRSPSYLRIWAGDAVISPQSFDTFYLLIAVLAQLEPANLEDPVAYAKEKWGQMELLKDYHRRAGWEIRTALLERVKSLIAERTSIDAVLSIDIPGVRSGRMGLLRISAVDGRAALVPRSRLFQIQPVKVI